MLTGSTARGTAYVTALVIGAVTAYLLFGAVFVIAAWPLPSDTCEASSRAQADASSAARDDIPTDYLALYRTAGNRYQIPWNILAAIGKMESDHGRYPGSGVRHGSNYAGAAGPMQIGIGGAAGNEWARFGVDGNGDSRKDVHDPQDAIPGAARILIEDKGFEKNAREAVRRYNGSGPAAQAYAAKAMALAKRYSSGRFTTGSTTSPLGGCTSTQTSGFATPKGPDVHGNWPAERPREENITPRTRRARDMIKNMFGVPKGIGCYRTGPDAQDHGKGRACDFMISSGSPSPKQTKLGYDIANWATTHAKQLGINYVIYRQHIWNIERSREGWREMENRGSLTANHFDHVHVSIY